MSHATWYGSGSVSCVPSAASMSGHAIVDGVGRIIALPTNCETGRALADAINASLEPPVEIIEYGIEADDVDEATSDIQEFLGELARAEHPRASKLLKDFQDWLNTQRAGEP